MGTTLVGKRWAWMAGWVYLLGVVHNDRRGRCRRRAIPRASDGREDVSCWRNLDGGGNDCRHNIAQRERHELLGQGCNVRICL